MRLISVIVAALCVGPMAQAQTTAWLGGMTSTETEKTYSYGTQIPKDVGTWLMQNGTRFTHPTDQGDRVFYEVSVDWDTSNHANPANGGMFSLHTGNGYGAKWMTPSNDLKNSTAIVALMDKNIVSEHGTWHMAHGASLSSW